MVVEVVRMLWIFRVIVRIMNLDGFFPGSITCASSRGAVIVTKMTV